MTLQFFSRNEVVFPNASSMPFFTCSYPSSHLFRILYDLNALSFNVNNIIVTVFKFGLLIKRTGFGPAFIEYMMVSRYMALKN